MIKNIDFSQMKNQEGNYDYFPVILNKDGCTHLYGEFTKCADVAYRLYNEIPNTRLDWFGFKALKQIPNSHDIKMIL